jgi:hypothetical protein
MGKQIRIYLSDNTATGIRHAEITNWTGQALACPRTKFQDLKEWSEIKRPGVYLLFGIDEISEEDVVYIGESEVVFDRLSSHIAGKEFWSELVTFTSKDDNLTKGHVKYLESRLIQLATDAKRYTLKNSVCPQLATLPRGDKDSMEEFLISIQTLLGVLGHKVLEPYLKSKRTETIEEVHSLNNVETLKNIENIDSNLIEEKQKVFILRTNEVDAKAVRTDEGIVVLSGSLADLKTQSSFGHSHKAIREKLLSSGVIFTDGNYMKFSKDQLFNSPSQAAAIIVGYSINGRDAWKLENGMSYAAYDQQIMEQLSKTCTSQ